MYSKDMKIYSGKELKEYVQDKLKNVKYNRVEVIEILRSFRKSNCIKAILGEKGQGKSTVLLGIIDKIDSYEDTILINGVKNSKIGIYDLIRYIRENKIKNKFIFIDEIQFFDDYTRGVMQLLYDEVVEVYDDRVFITGTLTQYLTVIFYECLFCRMDMFELLPITFTDDKQYFNRDTEMHCINGGYIQDIKQNVSVRDTMTSIKYFLDLTTKYDDMSMEAMYNYLSTSVYNVSHKNFREYLKRNKYILESKYLLDTEYLLNLGRDYFFTVMRELDYSGFYKIYVTKSSEYKNGESRGYVSRNNLLSCYLIQSLQGIESDGNLIKHENLGIVFEDAIRVLLLSNKISADKVRTKNGKFKIDVVSDEFIAEIRLSDRIRDKYYKNLMNTEYLNKFGLIDKMKILVYNGKSYYNKETKIFTQNIYDFEKELNIKSRIDPEQRKNYNEKLDKNQLTLKR